MVSLSHEPSEVIIILPATWSSVALPSSHWSDLAPLPSTRPGYSPSMGLWHLTAVKRYTVCLWDPRAETPEHRTSRNTVKFRRLFPGLCALISLHVDMSTLHAPFIYSDFYSLLASYLPCWMHIWFPFGTRFFPSDLLHYSWFNLFWFPSNILSGDPSKWTC